MGGLSLADMASRASWTVDYDSEGSLAVIVPATRETGLLADRLFFRLMNMPEGTDVHVVFYDTEYKTFKENELGYKEDDYKYGSRAVALAKRLSSDKIKTYALAYKPSGIVPTMKVMLRQLQTNMGVENIIYYGLSASNYQTGYFGLLQSDEYLGFNNRLSVYLNGTSSGGLTCHLLEEQGDALGIENRPIDDSLQTHMAVSTVMFNVLNTWVSGQPLRNKTLSVNLATGEIEPQ